MELSELMAALDATLIRGRHEWDGRCPLCGRATDSHASGLGVRLCLPCSEADCGEPADELAARVSRKMTLKAYRALPHDNDGKPILPPLTWKQWVALRSIGGR